MYQISNHMDSTFRETSWYRFLDHGMQDLVRQTYSLLKHEKEFHKSRYHDYSFLLFPIAKAYEGFLKKMFKQLGIIDEEKIYSRYFRIGKSLNPELPERYQDESWLYDDLVKHSLKCQQSRLADQLWEAWVSGRNQVFHYYFPDHNRFIDLNQAEEKIDQFIEAMDAATKCLNSPT